MAATGAQRPTPYGEKLGKGCFQPTGRNHGGNREDESHPLESRQPGLVTPSEIKGRCGLGWLAEDFGSEACTSPVTAFSRASEQEEQQHDAPRTGTLALRLDARNLIRWLQGDQRLQPTTRDMIASNLCHNSVASPWIVAITPHLGQAPIHPLPGLLPDV